MRKYFVLLIFSMQLFATNKVMEKPFYGKEITTEKAVPLDSIISDFPKYADKNVVMEARVEKVCAQKGCWMTLQGSDKTFRVKFHDYSYFVPLSLIVKKVWVEGEVERKTISVKDTRHYLKDAGASQAEIEAVIKPSFEYRVVAHGVRVIK